MKWRVAVEEQAFRGCADDILFSNTQGDRLGDIPHRFRRFEPYESTDSESDSNQHDQPFDKQV